MTRLRWLGITLVGLWFGFSLDRMGFADYSEVHRMFTLSSPRLYFTFGGGVGLLMAVLWGIRRRYALGTRVMHRGTIGGAVLFGVGWALTGTCPAAAAVQLGTGALPALATLVGIGVGAWAYTPINRRWLRAPSDSCSD